ncbi:hypothetical protein [Dictyobacter aurantiacus]|nr:hypothetical protein [Dictyobacter aurantiacus]
MIDTWQVVAVAFGGLVGGCLVVYADVKELEKIPVEQRPVNAKRFLDLTRDGFFLCKFVVYVCISIIVPPLALLSNMSVTPFTAIWLGASVPSLIKTGFSSVNTNPKNIGA